MDQCSKKDYDMIIYHRDCSDGFASAWIAWSFLNNENIVYHASQPNDKYVPNILGKKILMVDITFLDNKLMDSIRTQSKSLCVIDHHPQAKFTLREGDSYILDENHSAAYLSWKHFYPNKPVPIFIKLIEDEDIKGRKYNYTMYFASALPLDYKKDPSEFKTWNNLLKKENVAKVIKLGKSVSKYKEDLIRRNLFGALMKFENYTVIVHNFVAVGLWNDIANMLAKKHIQTADFALVWAYEHFKKRYNVRLRSLKDTVDLNKLAYKYGGGGHKRAAVFYTKDIFALLKEI